MGTKYEMEKNQGRRKNEERHRCKKRHNIFRDFVQIRADSSLKINTGDMSHKRNRKLWENP